MKKLEHAEIENFRDCNLYLRQEVWDNQSWGSTVVVLDDDEARQIDADGMAQLSDQNGTMDYVPCRYQRIVTEDIKDGLLDNYWET